MKSILKSAILSIARNVKSVRTVARFISSSIEEAEQANRAPRDTYPYLKRCFIANGQNHQVDVEARTELIRKFELIDEDIDIASSPTDGLIMAEILLNIEASGSIVECGCFTGGSTAKLSLIAKELGTNLVVFDSFEGLPEVTNEFIRDHHCRRSENWITDWTAGRYEGRIELVQSNVEKYGDFSRTQLVKGWFNETLRSPNLPEEVIFAFCDVDLANSARDCLTGIWPHLSEKGVFTTHDTAYIKVLQEFYKPKLWREEFKAIPPILFGAGFGIYDSSPHLGYMVKGEDLSPEYLKSLTIDK